MSGETPPTVSGRFQSHKKFPGSSMSPGSNHSPNGGRGGHHNRSRVLMSKVSAPRPINLPSLRRENAAGGDWSASSGGGGGAPGTNNSTSSTSGNNHTGGTSGGGWGTSPSMSPFSTPQKWDHNNAASEKPEWQTTSSPELQSLSPPAVHKSSLSPPQSSSSTHAPATSSTSSSPGSPPYQGTASRVWAAVSTTSTPTLSAKFPTAAETATPESTATTTTGADKSPKSDKQQQQQQSEIKPAIDEKITIGETEHLDWDEIVRQDLENDDSPADTSEIETVLPSDRFTEDYDRSYPPQIHPITDDANPPPPTHPTSSIHTAPTSGYHNKGGYARRDSNSTWGGNHDWNGYSRTNNQERRASADRNAWGSGGGIGGANGGGNRRGDMGERGRGRFGNRRPSHDRKSNFQPTVLQRPRRMSELSARSDRSSSRDEIPQSVVAEQSQSPPQQHQQMPPVSLPAVVEGSPSSRPTELTAAQREVMLSAAERAKKRRDEEEAEFAAIRERARKKAEALAAMCESKSPKSSTDAAKPEEKKPALDANAVATTDTAPKSENKSPVDGNKTTTDKISTTNDAEKQKPEEPLSETGGKDEPATSSTPSANKKDVKASPQPPTDKPHEKEGSDEDDQRWNDYVGNLKESKPAERASTSDSNASAWNAYATRLQSSSEKRMNAAIDKYAAERNLDPSLFDDMRHTDREPLRLHRQQRGDYQGRDSRDRRGQNNRNDRNDHRQHRDEHISSKRRDKTSANGSTGEHSVSPINVELWPALGQQTNDDTATTTSSSPAKPTKKKTEQKVSSVAGEDSSIKKKKKRKGKQTKDEIVDDVDEKASGQKDDTVPVIPEDEVQEKEGGATAAAAALEKEEDTKPSEKNATTKSTTEASADLSPSTGADDGVGNEPVKEQKGGGEVQEPPQQPACDIDTNKQRQQEPQDYHPEEVLEPLPEMIEASESGSLVSHNITDTVPTPESESCGRARTYSAAAVFGHWTRAERHDFLQKSKESVFPEAIERLAELKPANLTFRTVSDDRQAPSVEDNNDSIATTTSFDHTRASPIMGGDHGLPNHIAGGLERGKEYMMMDPMHAAPMAAGATSSLNDFTQQQRQFSYAVPAFDGNKVSPQQHHMAAAAPMSMTAGQQNFPLLVYQVPYNNRGPFMPGSSTATTGYGVSADGQQPGMFVPASSMSQQQPQQHQQQSMMGVYLLSPHQMLPPWSGMPLNNGSNNNNTHHHRYQQHHNQRRRH